MKKLVAGIVAHVDAGKTTLSEALLYSTGAIRKLGRVDNRDAFLDTNSIERKRGITIFAKIARLPLALPEAGAPEAFKSGLNNKTPVSDKASGPGGELVLVDTPGHVDFAAEMERTLSVLDAAILLVSGPAGIQAHTKTLWKLLEKHNIPTVIFINKMDMNGADSGRILDELRHAFSENIAPWESEELAEAVAATDDALLEAYLSGALPGKADTARAVMARKVFPCLFGSALKLEGVDRLLSLLGELAANKAPAAFKAARAANPREGASAVKAGSAAVPGTAPKSEPQSASVIVYKISRDKDGNRLTHLKVTGGVLKAKEFLGDEKINEIRLYSGDKYELVKEASAGEICTVTGPRLIKADAFESTMIPVLSYAVSAPPDIDEPRLLHILRELEEEMPELKVTVAEQTKEISVMLMGEVQTEVLAQLIADRFGFQVTFGEGRIAYKETITAPVRGVGHYEPLKHYAEVHLLLEPRPRGAGMKFTSNLSVDVLATNWQRLILTHLAEKEHAGVLTGSPITDIEITVTAGRDHLKHTEGGDFRQSTYRAVRQALMKTIEPGTSLLLEPYYRYEIVVPENCTGRVMADAERMAGTCELVENKGGFATLTGRAPVATMKNYMNEVRAYTKGLGTLSLAVEGYFPCHNADEVIKSSGYNPDTDGANPSFSVFCSHGAGYPVPWQEVDAHKHIEDEI
ncbi:MAG: TetM/TetW/TetO/TetS family tetracycline resistance ribosomal protection protein [Treponema sp.]|nr:TetM/TetW/TetO/TetS family tetracycline resistance ribosomal protection protein [Candidatus Treponema caballi]